jgi:NodT family efflux transporter outer membrane factor (OMF) lipoprotein
MDLRKPIFSLGAVFLWLGLGCAVGPRYERPEIAVPKAFSEGKAEAPASFARWWTGFRDPVLDSLVQRAVEGNLDVKIAAARIREARAARGIAISAALPQVTASGGYSRSKQLVARTDGVVLAEGSSPRSVFEAGFDASWEIDVFGGVRRDAEAALAQVEAAEEAREDLLVTLVADVTRNYIELRGTDRQIEILDETVEAQKESLALTQARFDSGLGSELDVSRAEGLVEATASQRPALEVLRHQSALRLGVLLGVHPEVLLAELGAPGALPPAPPEIPEVLPSELLTRRPDLRRRERELAAATARIGVAKADLFPRFNLLGSFGRSSSDLGSLNASSQFWSGGLFFQWPIFAGGRIRANIRVQEARQEQALLQYQQGVLIALEEVENALSTHGQELRRQDFLRASVAANRRALELATERYTSGLESFLAVLDAQRSVYAAEDQLVQSERNVAIALIAVYKALGGGWSTA